MKLFQSLEPEAALMAQLAPKWRHRFEKALSLLHQGLVDAMERQEALPRWEEIAKSCAVSPLHFHRMFRLVFAEAPGQFLARQRMSWAVILLFEARDMSITDVAHLCGFSSSQALAKALKRETGMSAKKIRAITAWGDEYETLIARLAQPNPAASHPIEKSLAKDLKYERVELNAVGLALTRVTGAGLLQSLELWGKCKLKGAHELVSWIPVDELEKEDMKQTIWQGYVTTDEKAVTHIVPPGPYLSLDVEVSTMAGYEACWDAMYHAFLTLGYDIDEARPVLEWVHNPDSILGRSTRITLYAPLLED